MHYWFPIALAAVLGCIAPTHASAQSQRNEMSIEEQPGYVPSTEEEAVDPGFQRQLVYFRTSEQPGTIIVYTSQRYLYVVQGNNRALLILLGLGAAAAIWALFFRS